MIRRLLIANRGEIAVRIARTCRELGIGVVAVHSSADRESEIVRMADVAVTIGPAAPRQSYLNIPNIIEAALRTGADGIHPGYGFLSEDPDFAEICQAEGLTFVGPPPSVMQDVGNKATARRLMIQAGLPLLPGVVEPIRTAPEGQRIADEIGYPVIIKAAAGGGGRGMTVVRAAGDFADAFMATRAVARAVFRDPAVYVERYLPRARHVEVQVLCDQFGNGISLGERDCSVQRRHQKLLEEGPAAHLTPQQRRRLGALAVRGALSVGYTGAGTMEFLVDDRGGFYFMEMNARIQVEHPVTEMLTGIDLVREQILIAGGLPLGRTQDDVRLTGAAIECRINAEDPARGFAPAPGRLEVYRPPSGPWTRMDTGYREGDQVSPHYDSLIGKLVVWAPTREQAMIRMDRALAELHAQGPGLQTTTALHRALLRHPEVRAGRHDVEFLDRELPRLLDAAAVIDRDPAAAGPLLPTPEPTTASGDRPDPGVGSEPAASSHPGLPSPSRVRAHLLPAPTATAPTATAPTATAPPRSGRTHHLGHPAPATTDGGHHMTNTISSTFTMTDLMALLTKKAGLPAAAQTADPSAGFEDVGLDSLAFLAMQTELQDRCGVEMPDDKPDHYTFGEIVAIVQGQFAARQVAEAS